MKRTATENGTRPGSSVGQHWLLVLICCAPLLALRASLLFTPHGIYDFIFYWAAGHLFLTGGHPYSEAAMRTIVLSYGGNPALAGHDLLSSMGDASGRNHGNLAICPGAEDLVPRPSPSPWIASPRSAYGLTLAESSRKAWIAILIAATFIPMGGAELVGQITPLMLACLTAFLLLLQSRHNFAAGLVLLGFGFKPHLLYLVFLAVLFWIAKTRAWTLAAGALVSYGTATAGALLYNSNSLDYLHNTVGAALKVSCGLGGALRILFGEQHVWLQFLPCFLGAVWFVYYWIKEQRRWQWQLHLPLLLIVSVTTSPYCWNHDCILILPALMALAVRGAFRSIAVALAYLAVQALAFGLGLAPAWASTAGALWIAVYYSSRRQA